MGEVPVWFAHRARTYVGDADNSCRLHAGGGSRGKVREAVCHVSVADLVSDLGANLVAAGTGTRTKGSRRNRTGLKRVQRVERGFDHAVNQSPPARVDDREGGFRRECNWHAVGCRCQQRKASLLSNRGVCFVFQQRLCLRVHNTRAVHLPQLHHG